MSEWLYEQQLVRAEAAAQEAREREERFAAPCRWCRFTGPRWHEVLCDECVMRREVEWRREWEEYRLVRERARRDREAARVAVARLPLGRRQLVELSGLSFGSSAEVLAEAYGEVV